MGDVVSSHLDESRREMITGKRSAAALCNNFIKELFFKICFLPCCCIIIAQYL